MSSARMCARIPGARSLGRAQLAGWAFVCNKTGMDGSAKANLVPRADAVTWGVLYSLPREELPRLDAIEGGYRRAEVCVLDDQQQQKKCTVYVSERTTNEPVPFDWYKQHMLTGALEHELPHQHVQMIEALPERPGEQNVS